MHTRYIRRKTRDYLSTYCLLSLPQSSIARVDYPARIRSHKVHHAEAQRYTLYAKRFLKIEYQNPDLGIRQPELTMVNLLRILQRLERRLDRLVYTAGFARSILEAKQMINHKRVRVNHTYVSLPAMQLQPGDLFQVHTDVCSQVRTHTLEVDPYTRTAIYLFHPYQAEFHA